MLFVSNTPIQVEVSEDRKVIVLTHNKLMFSQLDFIQQYLAMPLITLNPKKFYYEPSVMQTMVISDTTIEVYYCDWKTQMKLIKVIILNNQTVEGVYYEKQVGWQVFGQISQYEPAKINFYKTKQAANVKVLSQCFINKSKYILSNEKLEKSEQGANLKEVWWKDRMMVIKNCNFNIQMSGSPTLDKKRDIICINSIYALIVNKYEVLITIVEPTIAFNHNSLLISHIENNQLTVIKKYENNSFIEIGTINKKSGELCGAFLYQNDLMLLIYQDKQILLNSLPLVQQKQTSQSNHKKHESRKRLFQSISRIMEQSHEQGSQFIQRDGRTTFHTEEAQKKQEEKEQFKHNFRQNQKQKQKDYSPNEKPVIRDVVINDEDFRSNSLNEGTSEVLSRSGIDPQQRQVNQQNIEQSGRGEMSFQINRNKGKNAIQNQNGSFKAQKRHFKTKRQVSAQNLRRTSSLINSKESQKRIKKEHNQQAQNISQISEKSKTSLRQKSQKGKGMVKNEQNNSVLSNQSFQDHAQTPAFGFDNLNGVGSDRWGAFDKQWNDAAKDQINEQAQQQLEQSICIQDQKSILKFVPQVISKKVQVFKPPNVALTSQLHKKIQKASYCSLISKQIQQDPDKIQEYLDLFLPNVLNQPQAPLFFERNINTHNPEYTKDKIKRLFKSELKNPQLKQKMTQALQLFRISEVPPQLLVFPPDFIKVISVLHKDIYIQDLLKPSQALVNYLLQSYFNIKNFPEQIITIEDEQIDITHPRNMLNVLLYLNQYLGLKIDVIIKVYCTKLIQENHLDVLKKITTKENIFEICDVPRSILDDVIVQRFNQLLHQSVENADYLWDIIEFLSQKIIDQYRIKLAIIAEFNKCNINFDLDLFLQIMQAKHDSYLFLQKIINENSCRNLLHLKIGNIYRSLYWLQEGQKIAFMTNQYIELVKSLAQKFCQKNFFYNGFRLLNTILSKTGFSFVVKMLKKYLNCKLINRIAIKSENVFDLQEIFPEIMDNPDIDATSLPHDKILIPQFSQSFSCSWTKFSSVFQKYLQGPLQIKVLVFCQINIANQLYLTLDQNQKSKFQKFLSQMESNLIVEIKDINEIDDSLNPKGLTSIKFDMEEKNEINSQIATSTINREQILLPEDTQSKKKIVYKSMTLIDHYNQVKKITRRNSDQKHRDDKLVNDNEDLMRVKLLVNRSQIIQQLCDIYENKQQDLFMRSLQLVDHEKIRLYHLDIFKAIVNKNIQYSLPKILPFSIFLSPTPGEAFQLCKEKIKNQISMLNFWLIYTIIQLLFKMGDRVCLIFFEKCILYLRNDNYNEVFCSILERVQPKLQAGSLNKIIIEAKEYNLVNIQRNLCQYRDKKLKQK